MTQPVFSGPVATPAKAEALVVSDRGPLVRALRDALERAGYDVIWAHNAIVGLDRFREDSPDLIIVDLELEDLPVLAFCEEVRKDATFPPSTPVMLLSTEPISREQRLSALRAGAWDCLPGPPDAEELLLKADLYVRSKLEADRAESVGLIDPITGLYNRQGLARRARELGAHAFRSHDALACVALSVDLDAVTDDHISSEDLRPTIVKCARALQAAGRPSDPIGRFAGAEFAVLAPATDAVGAQRMAERMTRTLKEVTEGTGAASGVPITAGYEAVTNLAYAPIGPVELLARAAGALRQAKAERSGTIRRFVDPA